MAPLQKFVTLAAIITISGQIIFLVNFFWSMFKGPAAPANPWDCTTLEWTLPSPTPAGGFGEHVPRVNRGAYEYSVPGAEKDYLMQDAPGS
jgi:cytochrome c oxidase subunit 1